MMGESYALIDRLLKENKSLKAKAKDYESKLRRIRDAIFKKQKELINTEVKKRIEDKAMKLDHILLDDPVLPPVAPSVPPAIIKNKATQTGQEKINMMRFYTIFETRDPPTAPETTLINRGTQTPATFKETKTLWTQTRSEKICSVM